ncbi:MAG TPA: hypothetical protein VGC53_11810 [Vicinamibacteria bacterium]|jgi:uncharacterized membrane protein YgdD (TMEM256/DUF423 family)
MSRRNANWLRWSRYYFGRALELVGLFLVTGAMVVFFGTSEMRPMLAVTGTGGLVFFLGWLMARKNPE